MRRTSRDNAVCFKSLEQALEESPETYRHIDLICFGFPCQDISTANAKAKGLEGKRSSIFFECMRIVNILNPTWLLIENVPRLFSINGGRDFAVVLQTLSEGGYGYSWRVLDSQYFGVAQRRKRLFIVGCFGNLCPPEILFEQKSGRRVDKKKREIRGGGICVYATNNKRADPTSQTLIANVVQATDYQKVQHGQFGNEGNLVAKTLQSEGHGRNSSSQLIANTVNAGKRGPAGRIWEDTYIAETDTKRKRAITRISRGLDTNRGIVIGNAVTVPVAEWIARRIQHFSIIHKDKTKTNKP